MIQYYISSKQLFESCLIFVSSSKFLSFSLTHPSRLSDEWFSVKKLLHFLRKEEPKCLA